MLSFARRQDLKPTPVYVPDLIEGMVGLLRSSLGPSIMINTRFGRGLGHVLADPNQLELSVLNLAVNARDAMPEGGLIIIEAREELGLIGNQDARCLCLSVKDNGEGMDEDTLAHADEPFFTTKGVGKGTGLGLSMVQGMAQQLGGKLQLRSPKGEGTLAEIYLPIAADSDTAGNPKQEPSTEIPASPKLVVLAVDDDSLVLLNTTAMLEDLGHKVFEASRGHKALEKFWSAKRELILSSPIRRCPVDRFATCRSDQGEAAYSSRNYSHWLRRTACCSRSNLYKATEALFST